MTETLHYKHSLSPLLPRCKSTLKRWRPRLQNILVLQAVCRRFFLCTVRLSGITGTGRLAAHRRNCCRLELNSMIYFHNLWGNKSRPQLGSLNIQQNIVYPPPKPILWVEKGRQRMLPSLEMMRRFKEKSWLISARGEVKFGSREPNCRFVLNDLTQILLLSMLFHIPLCR